MFGRSKKQRTCYAVMGRDGYVHSAGNPDLREGWTLEDLAKNFVVNSGDQCFVWAGEVFSPMRVMGETAEGLERQFGPADAYAAL